MSHVSLEVALALKAWGFDQGVEGAHEVWQWFYGEWQLNCWGSDQSPYSEDVTAAAPDLFDALEWTERDEQGWEWVRTARYHDDYRWRAWCRSIGAHAEADTADGLLLAMARAAGVWHAKAEEGEAK